MPPLQQITLHAVARSKTAFILLFIPCFFLFPRLISLFGAKSFSNGEAPSATFFVAIATDTANKSFELVPFDYAIASNRSYFPPENASVIQVGEFETNEYRVLSQSPVAAVIETVKKDDDYTITSQYRVDGRRITPLKQRLLGPGHGFAGVLMAYIFCASFFYLLRRFTEHRDINSAV
jgi:hypothetical protein